MAESAVTASLTQADRARRASRFTYARRRVDKITAGTPALTDQERTDLALRMLPEHRREYVRTILDRLPKLTDVQLAGLEALLAPEDR